MIEQVGAAKRRELSLLTKVKSAQIELVDAQDRYGSWPAPTVIISDGPYGLGLFPGEPVTSDNLGEWYRPHIEAWSEHALPETTLWFWCNEIGWANVHPVLAGNDWQYRSLHVWDKGIAHVAGNVNGRTIRRFPVVTEVCVQYVRDVRLLTGDGMRLPMKEWLRHEWLRSGLSLYKTNEACGVKNAATRKYFTRCHLWYLPPPEMMKMLSTYAHRHGKPTNWPYFSLDGSNFITAEQWSRMRAKWNHTHAVTNVWNEPAVRGTERVKDQYVALHANQKPLRLMERIIQASSSEGDVVWEPFGGMCTGTLAALRTQRRGFGAEIISEYYEQARKRLLHEGSIQPLFDLNGL